MLPEGTLVSSATGRVELPKELVVSISSARLESSVLEASRRRGSERLAALQAVIDQLSVGEYLSGARSRWVEDRRRHFADLMTDARLQAAELAFVLGRLDRAAMLVDAVVLADRYREAAWRLKMRVANAFGDDDGVIRAFGQLDRALKDVGAAPAAASRQLLDNLRR